MSQTLLSRDKMAAGVLHLLRISCSVCIVLHLCLEGGVNGVQVPDGVVYTELQRTAEIGKSLVLTCRFYGTPIAVYWKKGVDPTTAPNLITWVEGESASGSCVHDKSCNITGDYSLVIRSVKVSDQGSYICRVSNYLGVLIHNFTEVTVFAAPSEPYPLIEECQPISNGPQSCRLPASDSVTITCTASNYFPDIDLFFIHESITTNATYSQISEETNVDLTKNKSVSIVARPSEKPYVCVASRIPGPQDRRTVSVIVHLPESTVAMTTAPSNQTLSNGQVKAEKIVIPIVVILIAISFIFIFIWWRMKKYKTGAKRDPESMPLHERPQINGKLSFFEMWYLVQNMDETDINKFSVNLTAGGDDNQTAYSRLCQWKDTNTLDNEALGLKNILVGQVGEEPWRDLCERRYDTTSSVSKERLDYILWWIVENKDVAEVTHFLNELIPDFILKATPLVSPGEKHHVVGMVEDGRKVLSTWREGDHTTSQVIQLSLALEMAKCKPVDRTFFMVPENLLKEISPHEVQRYVYRLAERHSWRLATAVNIKDKNKISTIIDENKDELLNIEQMINTWLVEQRCSNYEKRCMLDDAIIKIGRLDMADVFGTTSYRERSEDDHNSLHNDSRRFDYSSTFDDDIESLVKDLPTRAIPSFLKKLGIQSEHDDIDVQKRLRCWRDEKLSTPEGCSLQHLATIYRDILLETNCNYAFILNDDDLENVVASMTFQKQIELAQKLGIKRVQAERSLLENLKEWRDRSEDKEYREKLEKALHDIELSGSIADRLPENIVYQVEFVRLAWAMFSADVSPLVTTLGMEMGKRTSQPRGTVDLLSRLFEKSNTIFDSYPRRGFCIALRKLGYHDVARMSYYGFDASLSELCNMALGLSKQEILKVDQHLELANSSFLVSDGGYDIVTFMEIWKGQHSAEPVHYRLNLAFGLRAAGKTELARRLIAGDYGTVAVNPDVVKSICNGMGNGQLERLAEHLRLNAKADNPVDISALVIQWATEWFSKAYRPSLLESFKDTFTFTNEEKSRKKEIDNLFKAGFVRFAEELMLLEVSRLRPIKQVTDEPCESENQETPEQNVHENNPPIEGGNEASAFFPSTDGQDPPSNNENEETQL